MAGGNPVFDRLNKQIEKERYAGFGTPQPQQGAQGATAGYATQDTLSAQQLNDLYARQSAGPVDTDRVTLDDVVMKSLALFVLLVASGVASWFLVDAKPSLASPLWLGGMLIGVAMGFAIAFMKRVVVPLIALYAIVEGVFLGAFSNVINSIPNYRGVVLMAVLATVCTFAGMYAAYATGLIKVNDRMRRMFTFLIIGYGLFILLQFVLQMMGVLQGWGFGGSGPLGIGLSLLGTGLAAWSLAFDFDSIDRAVAVGAPRKFSWLLAHGLIVSVVWLYIEFVRLFARLRD
jgi:uncharacterized YccA/Bax inhibitor family protein